MRTPQSCTALLALAALLAAAAPTADGAKQKKASDYFTLCRRDDPALGECIQNAIMAAKPLLLKGIPELKIPTFDPLRMDAIELREGQGSFEFILTMRNVTISGLRDFVMTNASVNPSLTKWHLAMRTPVMRFDSDYEMKGRLLALPIQGNGKATMTFKGVNTISNSESEIYKKNGKDYSRVTTYKWDIIVENAQSHFTNLFNGDKTLGETTNKFLNDNWRDAFETYKHLPEDAFGQFFQQLSNGFFEQFPLEELYIDYSQTAS